MTTDQQALTYLKKTLELAGQPGNPVDVFTNLWQGVALMHSMELNQELKRKLGDKVCAGPFKDMRLGPSVMKSNVGIGPYLLGCYEAELHPTFERVIATGYQTVLNIGCSFGWYSAGLALRMPQAKVFAFEIDAGEKARCAETLALNELTGRVTIDGEFKGENFAAYANSKTLVLMDIEGGEIELLDPARWPALQKMDVIVELHDLYNATISQTIPARFKETHEIEIIRNRSIHFPLETVFGSDYYIDPVDSASLTWELRAGPTPWGVFRAKT